MGVTARPLAERFWTKVNKDGPLHPTLGQCWSWIGAHGKSGYGNIGGGPGRKPRSLLAHRVAWEILEGPIPDGLHILHHCDNPNCVNPAHLVPGTRVDNMRHCAARGRLGHGGARGEANSKAKLSASQVTEIRTRHKRGERQVDLAAAYGVSQVQISNITRGVSWRFLLDAAELERLAARHLRQRPSGSSLVSKPQR